MKNYYILPLLCLLLPACSQHLAKYNLNWRTASEYNNFGYDVYRSDNSNGPFIKVTKTPILGAGTSDIIHSYSFTDENLEKDKIYYYYVESISETGQRRRFTPTRPSRKIKTESD